MDWLDHHREQQAWFLWEGQSVDSQQREFGIDLHRNFEDLNGCCGGVMENDLAKKLPKKFGVAFDR